MTAWLAGPANGVELPAGLQTEQRCSSFPLVQVDKGKKPNCIILKGTRSLLPEETNLLGENEGRLSKKTMGTMKPQKLGSEGGCLKSQHKKQSFTLKELRHSVKCPRRNHIDPDLRYSSLAIVSCLFPIIFVPSSNFREAKIASRE